MDRQAADQRTPLALDRQGHYWPSDLRGNPQRPLNMFPPGKAPGEHRALTAMPQDNRSYLAPRAAIDAAMWQEADRLRSRGGLIVTAQIGRQPASATGELATVVIGAVETVVAVADLPFFLAALGAGVAVLIILRGMRYRFAGADQAGRARGLAEPEAPNPPLEVADSMPRLPPMEAGPELAHHDGGFDPAIRLPPCRRPSPGRVFPP